jgi:hypothetical protein
MSIFGKFKEDELTHCANYNLFVKAFSTALQDIRHPEMRIQEFVGYFETMLKMEAVQKDLNHLCDIFKSGYPAYIVVTQGEEGVF